jgi:anti-anti-sigma factor
MEMTNAHHIAQDAHIDQAADVTTGREPRILGQLPEAFRIFESTADGSRMLALSGELDLSNAAELGERLAGNVDTVLDLSDLSFIDSSGIHVLISAAQRAQSEGWTFSVQNAQPAVLRLIKLVGLDQHLALENQNGEPSHPEQSSKQPDAAEKHATPLSTSLGQAAP